MNAMKNVWNTRWRRINNGKQIFLWTYKVFTIFLSLHQQKKLIYLPTSVHEQVLLLFKTSPFGNCLGEICFKFPVTVFVSSWALVFVYLSVYESTHFCPSNFKVGSVFEDILSFHLYVFLYLSSCVIVVDP